jgi:hypothetical protein
MAAKNHEEKNQLARASSTTRKALTQNEKTQLLAQAATKVLNPAVKHGFTDLQPVGFSRIASTPQLVTGETSDWLILPATADPLYQQGRLAAPPRVRAHIRELRDAGVFFDALTIAHEVPAGSVAQVKDFAELQRLLEPQTPKSLSVLTHGVGMFFAGIGRVGKRAAQLRQQPSRSLVSLRVSLDPMLFGAVVVTPPATVGDAALYFLIDSWDY